MKIEARILLPIAAVILLLCFQNCSVPNSVKFSGSESSKATVSEGNGQGYDGKTYVLIGDLCPDASNIHAKIVLRSATAGDLVRNNCQDIAPVSLGSNDFQINVSNPDQLDYLNQQFVSQIVFGAIPLDVTSAKLSAGFRYELFYDFPTPPDTLASLFQSKLQLYENGIALGPAHSIHVDIANFGQGRFSHFTDGNAPWIYFSATDNSNPATNGRVYSYKILN